MNDSQMPADDATDQMLLRDACPSSDDIDDIYRKFVPVLRQIAESKGVPTSEADDRVHDVFTSYILHRADVREPGRYLMGAMRNATSDYWRGQSRERALFDDSADVEDGDGIDDGIVDAISARKAVSATLAALGPSCRDALRQYYLNGDTAAEIAQQRDTSPGYIHRLLNLCRRRALEFYLSLAKVS